MRLIWLIVLLCCLLAWACVDPEDLTLRGTVDVIVVDGTITNLAEPQIIRLNRSKADSITGRFGTLPLTKAHVEVVVDSSLIVAASETYSGTYQLPGDFRGQIGHAYQLRFTLADGTRYLSSQQIMPAVPPLARVTAQFNPNAITPAFAERFTAGHDLFADVQDPGDTPNYYRWQWTLYEPQEWCRSCYQGIYVTSPLEPILPYTYPYYYRPTGQVYEDCFYPPLGTPAYGNLINHRYDYPCRSQCWEVINSQSINVFSDRYINGNMITKQLAGHVPYYQARPCLVDIRQGSLTRDAFTYYDLFQQQTEKVGGLTDTPPTALGGNVHNMANEREIVIGYFSASAVSVWHYYLERKDTGNVRYPGLFYALRGRMTPSPEGRTEQDFILNTVRPPTAVCGPIDQRTPVKPVGWPD